MRYTKLNHAARVSIAEKQIKRMILVLNVSSLHVFLCRCKSIFLEFLFVVNTGKNEHFLYEVQTKKIGSYMTENDFKISQKCNNKFSLIRIIFQKFVSKQYCFLDTYLPLTFCTQRRSTLFNILKTARHFQMKLEQCKQSTN